MSSSTQDIGLPVHLKMQSKGALDAVERLQALADELVEDLGNLAVLAAIDVHGAGRTYFASGHADLAKTEVADFRHAFQIGSQSKTLLAMTILLLERAGALDLDAAVAAPLELPIDPRITLRHLISNQSGLGELTYAFPQNRLDPRLPFKPTELVALALPQGQIFDPGSRFDYCNTGWVIAAMIVESACGRPFGEVVADLVLRPLGLANTWLGGQARHVPMLRGYVESLATCGMIDTSRCLDWAFGSGDGVSSVDDMLTLFTSLCAPVSPVGLTLGDLNSKPGTPSAFPYFSSSLGSEYGLGLHRQRWAGAPVWGHSGSTRSYLSGTWIDAFRGVTVTTCVTRAVTYPLTEDIELRYPRARLFAVALSTAYALSADAASQSRGSRP